TVARRCNDSVRLAFACSAHCSYWALWTLRLARHTDQRPQLHHCLIELPGALAVLGDELPRQSPHRRCTLHVARDRKGVLRSEEHTSELQSPCNLVCRLLLEKKNTN